jgi:hypothetical protein
LAIGAVLDLHPGRRFRRVRCVCLLRDDAPHVAIANGVEQLRAACKVIHEQNRLRPPPEPLPKEPLPLRQGPRRQVVAIQPQQIERIEAERPASAHQFREHGAAVRPGTHDLAVWPPEAASGQYMLDWMALIVVDARTRVRRAAYHRHKRHGLCFVCNLRGGRREGSMNTSGPTAVRRCERGRLNTWPFIPVLQRRFKRRPIAFGAF